MENHRRVFTIGKQIRNVSRLGQIASVFAKHGYGSLLERLGIDRLLSSKLVKKIRQSSRPQEAQKEGSFGAASHFRKALEELGPTFVKLGQMLAVREDLLPKTFVRELKKLHSHVESWPYGEMEKILHEELGDKIDLFESIEKTPLASGSIGQIYMGVLKNGSRVAIKIQRPHIKHQIEVDLDLMELIAGLIDRHIPELKFIRPKETMAEFRRATLGELDFVREAANTSRVALNFSGVAYIKIPEIFWELTTTKVLVMSYLEGWPVSEQETLSQKNLDPKILLDRAVKSFLQMVFVDGFYHGDLHPGNLFALENNHIGLLDFGVTIKIGRMAQRHLAGLLMDLVKEDFDSLVVHFLELSDPGADFDQQAFAAELSSTLSPYMGLSLEHMKSGKILWEVATISAKYGAPMPRELVLFLRTMTAFEGIAFELNPQFDMIKACEDFTGVLVKEMYSTENLKEEATIIARDVAHLMRHAPYQMRRLLQSANEGELALRVESEHFAKVQRTLDRASYRLSLSMVVTGLLLGSAILASADKIGPYDASLVSLIGFAAAGVLCVFLFFSVLRRKI